MLQEVSVPSQPRRWLFPRMLTLSGRWPAGSCRDRRQEVRPGITEVKGKWHPPYEVVKQAENSRGERPLSRGDKKAHPYWTQHLAGQAHRCNEPAIFRSSCNLQIKNPVQTYNHAKTRKYSWICGWRHSRVFEEPLRMRDRADTKGDIVETCQTKCNSVQLASCVHRATAFKVSTASCCREAHMKLPCPEALTGRRPLPSKP